MKIFTIEKYQEIPVQINEAWDFLCSPDNLKKITPPNMGFHITSSPKNEKMYSGQIISYIVKPLAGIPISWVTEITHVKEQEYFVDEQRFGPYAFWHHKHFLKAVDGGTGMHDLIHYALPFGPLGILANRLFVRKKLNEIFDYRQRKLESLFGTITR